MSGFGEVYLARHGETVWNATGRRQGILDSPLTGQGRDQAARVGALLATRTVDGIYSSPLGRAVATATIIGRRLNLPVTIIAELSEIDHGTLAGLTDAEIEERYPEEYEQRSRDRYHYRFPYGESYADADRRAAAGLARIGRQSTRHPLLVSHEMLGRMLLRHLLGLSTADALAWRHPHDAVYCIDARHRRHGLLPA